MELKIDQQTYTPSKTIPVVDLSDPDKALVSSMVVKASEEWGIFHVVNHGISMDLIRRLKEVGTQFFELPETEKLRSRSETRYFNRFRRLDEESQIYRRGFGHVRVSILITGEKSSSIQVQRRIFNYDVNGCMFNVDFFYSFTYNIPITMYSMDIYYITAVHANLLIN